MAASDISMNDAVTMTSDGADSLAGNGAAGRSIGDGSTMRSKEERDGRRVFAPGDIIARRYVVEQMLGEGGMGIVYQCLDRVGGVKVAVKCLPPEVSRNADEMEDIRANYRLVSDLHHPNIAGARTLELDESTGDYYLVMDLAPGMSLKRWMKRNPQATMEAKLAILRQVAAALDYAHSEMVIHRDVKPENVMVDSSGRVKVLDFGLAAQIRSSQSRTSAAVASKGGTPGYKSPEQWLGRPQRAAADVYAFGVMAYWMFSGMLPFDGDDPSVLGHAVLTAPVVPVAGLSAQMNATLAKALAKTPEERFASCSAFVDELEEWVGTCFLCDRPKSSRLGVILAAVAIVVVAAVGNLLWMKSPDSNQKTPHLPNDSTPQPPNYQSKSGKLRTGDKRTITLPGGATMDMIYCNPGSFSMGSPDTEKFHECNEIQHGVTLTKAFWLGRYEVTQRQWRSVMKDNPSKYKDDNFPVENVSWNDCQRFVSNVATEVRRQLGGDARLPTEAEWEYACRAGTTGAYGGSGSLGEMGWYVDNSGMFNKKNPVGRKRSNAWGFHDMHGNVWEWCQDLYGNYPKGNVTDPTGPASGDYRVLRGGSGCVDAKLCRSARRRWDKPDKRFDDDGFRLCCSAE